MRLYLKQSVIWQVWQDAGVGAMAAKIRDLVFYIFWKLDAKTEAG